MNRLWYALKVRSNHERLSNESLVTKGMETYLPNYRSPSRRKDRNVLITRPLFPGYLFVRIDITGPARIEVIRTPGVAAIVSFAGRAAPVEDRVIASLQVLTGKGKDEVRPHPLVKEGKEVRVVAGPFASAQGILHVRDEKHMKLVVEIEFLGRAVAVPISIDDIQPIT